jgi:hypothetical protein
VFSKVLALNHQQVQIQDSYLIHSSTGTLECSVFIFNGVRGEEIFSPAATLAVIGVYSGLTSNIVQCKSKIKISGHFKPYVGVKIGT